MFKRHLFLFLMRNLFQNSSIAVYLKWCCWADCHSKGAQEGCLVSYASPYCKKSATTSSKHGQLNYCIDCSIHHIFLLAFETKYTIWFGCLCLFLHNEVKCTTMCKNGRNILQFITQCIQGSCETYLSPTSCEKISRFPTPTRPLSNIICWIVHQFQYSIYCNTMKATVQSYSK